MGHGGMYTLKIKQLHNKSEQFQTEMSYKLSIIRKFTFTVKPIFMNTFKILHVHLMSFTSI